MSINLDELTMGQVKELKALFGGSACDKGPATTHPYKVGGKYLIRTVTHYYTGELVAVYKQELVLKNAAWVADTGRFADCLKTGKLKEVEPYPDGAHIIVGRGAVIDVADWAHDLPNQQK